MEVKKKKKRYGDVVFTCDEKPGGWIVNPVLAGRNPWPFLLGWSGGKAFAGRTEGGNIWLTRIA